MTMFIGSILLLCFAFTQQQHLRSLYGNGTSNNGSWNNRNNTSYNDDRYHNCSGLFYELYDKVNYNDKMSILVDTLRDSRSRLQHLKDSYENKQRIQSAIYYLDRQGSEVIREIQRLVESLEFQDGQKTKALRLVDQYDRIIRRTEDQLYYIRNAIRDVDPSDLNAENVNNLIQMLDKESYDQNYTNARLDNLLGNLVIRKKEDFIKRCAKEFSVEYLSTCYNSSERVSFNRDSVERECRNSTSYYNRWFSGRVSHIIAWSTPNFTLCLHTNKLINVFDNLRYANYTQVEDSPKYFFENKHNGASNMCKDSRTWGSNFTAYKKSEDNYINYSTEALSTYTDAIWGGRQRFYSFGNANCTNGRSGVLDYSQYEYFLGEVESSYHVVGGWW